jgi:hypothetical protein
MTQEKWADNLITAVHKKDDFWDKTFEYYRTPAILFAADVVSLQLVLYIGFPELTLNSGATPFSHFETKHQIRHEKDRIH